VYSTSIRRNSIALEMVITGPIPPNIQKDTSLNFKYAGFLRKIDAPNLTEQYPRFLDDTIEKQSRDRNVSFFGQPSERKYVNEYIRYGIVAPSDMEYPIKRRPVFPSSV